MDDDRSCDDVGLNLAGFDVSTEPGIGENVPKPII
jgi:hypothetical protein